MNAVEAGRLATELEPVRSALLARAHADAAAEVADAHADADARLGSARAEAQRCTEDARVQGEADAAALLAAERARARRRSRTTVLQAQHDAFEELRRRSRETVRALRAEAGYPDLVNRLAAMVRCELGDDAVIREHPDGGVVGDAPGRHVELSLDVLTDAAVADLGADLAALWSP